MNVIDGDHLLNWMLDAPLFATLVETDGYRWKPTDRWLGQITGANGFHEPLMGKRVENRTFYASDVRFLAVKFKAAALAVYVKGPSLNTSPILLYADSLIGFPTKGNGGDVIVPFSVGMIKV